MSEAPLSDALLASVLEPYKPGCRYLEHAVATFSDDGPPARMHGRLAIPESWYIDDTGHFNAIEFNICYNQMIYALMAQCVVSGVTEPFGAMSLDEYLRRQLPDVLIHDFQSRFRQPMRAAASENVEGAGNARHSPGSSASASVLPAPNQNGSPDTRTTTRCPRSASTGSMENGIGQGWPRSPARARFRCRSPPNTTSAPAGVAA